MLLIQYYKFAMSRTNFRLADEFVAIVAAAVPEAVVYAGSLSYINEYTVCCLCKRVEQNYYDIQIYI